jgi:hypothetical protein
MNQIHIRGSGPSDRRPIYRAAGRYSQTHSKITIRRKLRIGGSLRTSMNLQPSKIAEEVAGAGSREDQWSAYLAQLASRTRVSDRTAALSRELWGALRRAHPTVPVPDAGPSEDGNFFLTLDTGQYFFEIEIRQDGTYDWFFKNRGTGAYEGDERIPIPHIPALLAQRIGEVFSTA